MRDTVRHAVLDGSPYQGYLYAYPHKTAYRPFAKPMPLADLWRDENKGAVALYLHVPFCEMRCGFCNLFTATGADSGKIDAYLRALKREAEHAHDALGSYQVAQAAIGGGTPTFLAAKELELLLEIIAALAPQPIPIAIETSPATVTHERVVLLKERGVSRVSLGVESFDHADLKAMGRPARPADAMTALSLLREADFASLNVDLIYGAEGQTPQSFLRSVELALRWNPEEIYLYPLYIRPLTGLQKRGAQSTMSAWDTQRLSLYREGRSRLLAAGYTQRSMRHFVRTDAVALSSDYACQEDGMLGLGPGARSYTKQVHYAAPYAVGRAQVWGIINAYAARENFDAASNGIVLTTDDRRRRFVAKSLLQAETGIDTERYRHNFATGAKSDFPELGALVELGLAERTGPAIRLTAAGVERSDAIGPLFVSPGTREAMEAYEWR
jgi:coproporphyrinogen III oxidase-like Fe-S oxidoreductase